LRTFSWHTCKIPFESHFWQILSKENFLMCHALQCCKLVRWCHVRLWPWQPWEITWVDTQHHWFVIVVKKMATVHVTAVWLVPYCLQQSIATTIDQVWLLNFRDLHLLHMHQLLVKMMSVMASHLSSITLASVGNWWHCKHATCYRLTFNLLKNAVPQPFQTVCTKLTSDGWTTSVSSQSRVTLTHHWIDKDLNRKSVEFTEACCCDTDGSSRSFKSLISQITYA